jgi:lipoprotein-anchoring transpeptidase ErfK/SrfK
MKSPMKTMIATSCLVLSVVAVQGQTKAQTGVDAAPVVAVRTVPAADIRLTMPVRHDVTRVIVVSLEDRRLALVEDGVVKKVYRVAVGKETTPSPTGTFTIVKRVENPTYYHDGKVVPPGPGNPVGTRWMGLIEKGYGIHGTNAPRSIGKAASHGCIRMGRKDLEELFAEVRSADTVEIVGERNEETAALFGTSGTPGAVSAAQVATAKAAPEETVQSPAADATAAATVTAVVPASR